MSDEPSPAPGTDADAAPELPPVHPRPVTPEQRHHLRRILACFVIVVVCLPLSGLGDAWAWLFVPMLVVAAFGMREAIRLRRTVTRSARP